eukprot:GDKH01005104.1.p1 GENE.GDKH01005104.1~~GDKH01005104.1.p1  ORF type:complete len:87 (-),score=4.56 GDKH01005104.1:186-446(-)
MESNSWNVKSVRKTDSDGRIKDLLATEPLEQAMYRLTFQTKSYFEAQGKKCFYPEVTICFEIEFPTQHHHVPLLISPYSFSTYRGS